MLTPSAPSAPSAPLTPGGSVGFVGVGAIARAMVVGLCRDDAPRILLSPRGAAVGARLAADLPTVQVCADNQAVADGSDVLVLSVRPDQAADVLADLRVGADTLVVSVVAGLGHDRLHALLGDDVTVVRAVPMPAVADRAGVTMVFPSHPVADALFDRLGRALPVSDQHEYDVLTAIGATISTHLRYLDLVTGWAEAQGLPREETETYLRSLFAGLAPALRDDRADRADPTDRADRSGLHALVTDHETPGGLNEQVRTGFWDEARGADLHAVLDGLLRRLT